MAFRSQKRFGLSILNYTVTSNHVYLLVRDNGEGVIPKSVQFIAGRVGQEYNLRKKRKGAYWEDRYHATAVQADKHLIQCLVYIDMNMVRAGVVKHPIDWSYGGYAEIQSPRERYSLIDYEGLKDLLNFKTLDELADAYRGWIEEALIKRDYQRNSKWTESIAVGSELFVNSTKEKFGIKAKGLEVVGTDGNYELREEVASYKPFFGQEKAALSRGNAFFWDDNTSKPVA